MTMGGLNIIMLGGFYQAPSIQNSCIFRPKLDELNILGTNHWNEHVKCYELK